MIAIQAVLFDRDKYKYADCIQWLLIQGFFRLKLKYRTTSQFHGFALVQPDETKYNYRLEQLENSGIFYIVQYGK